MFSLPRNLGTRGWGWGSNVKSSDRTNWISFVHSEETKPVANQVTRKISQQAPGTPQSGHSVNPSSAYINVACNPGFHSDDEEGVFEEAAV